MNYLGIDVAKAKLDGCLLLGDGRHKSKVVPNSEEGYKNLIAWCGKQGFLPAQLHAIMESTGCYHEPVACALVRAGLRVSVLNPARVREFAKSQGILSKNDGLDAFAIARFGAACAPEPWQPPAPEVSHLQALLSRREAIEQDLQREANRREKMAFTPAPATVLASLMEHIAYLERARWNAHATSSLRRLTGTSTSILISKKIAHCYKASPASAPRSARSCWPACGKASSVVPNNLLPIWAWCRYSTNRVLRSRDARACPRTAQPRCAQRFTCPQSLPRHTTHTSATWLNAWHNAANATCLSWAQLCENSSTFALV